jgi:hypothetical protein
VAKGATAAPPAIPGVARWPSAARPVAAADGKVSNPFTGVVRLSGDRPASGRVRLVPPEGAPPGTEEPEPVALAADGTVRLDAGGWSAALSVEVTSSQPRYLSVQAHGVARGVSVVLGEGRVHGTVWNGSRRPAEGVRISLASHLRPGPGQWESTAPGDPFRIDETTDVDGTYEFRDLPAGSYVVVARPEAEGDPRNIRSFEVVLGEGEHRRLDVGSPSADPLWTGVVRYADGAPVPGPASVFLRSESGERRMYVNFDAEGRIAQNVPTGTYRMEFVLPGAFLEPMTLVQTHQRLTVEDRPVVEDLRFPGTRIEARVEGFEAGADQKLVLTLTEPGEPLAETLVGHGERSPYSARVGARGVVHLRGLPAGTYAVSGTPRPLRLLDGTSVLHVPKDHARLDLVVVPVPKDE